MLGKSFVAEATLENIDAAPLWAALKPYGNPEGSTIELATLDDRCFVRYTGDWVDATHLCDIFAKLAATKISITLNLDPLP